MAADVSLARLLGAKRFAPYFLTQFFGAFNDNVYRQALILLITSGVVTSVAPNTLNNIALALFILPFFLFSALAGQFADKYDKAMLIRRVKLVEVLVMLVAAVGFYFDAVWFLLGVLFCMGFQSTCFGPLKYSIMPQHLKSTELVAGNALVQQGTYIAILLGSISGVALNMSGSASWWGPTAVIVIAIAGYLASLAVPPAPAADPSVKISWNIFSETKRVIGHAREVKSVWYSVLGISWFWFMGAAYTTQLKVYVDDYIFGTEMVYALLLATFSIAIGVGSVLCEKLSGKRVELGLVPIGSLGLSLFSIDLFFSYQGLAAPADGTSMTVREFIADGAGRRILVDLLGIGIFGGFYIVPLFSFVQWRTRASHLARVIGACNVLNALFMVASAIAGIVVVGVMGISIPGFFLLLAFANLIAAAIIYTAVPEFMIRFIIWMLTKLMYRVKRDGLEHIPEQGPCVLVCNHVSYVDALLIAGSVQRPVRFVMQQQIYDMPLLNYIFRTGKAIPVGSKTRQPEVYERAFVAIREALQDGHVVCIFPEGRLTTDGDIAEFRAGIEKIVAETPVPVIPMALQGLWGSFFSHQGGRALAKLPRRLRARVALRVGQPVPAEAVSALGLQQQVQELRGSRA
ncbi:MFS transporter [Alcanivorax quisquiliarum]|uniref:MFS transporter n=1 Tax=Alcanivorax quisquiliarum TaxID=2933565 RepID=A0ABT0E560_9GAMM|nr:MFS transporter [Alcanivorax quisquiliarum]MCK0536925.1 MFS transporter [Alcanivorax quisquiliarum]